MSSIRRDEEEERFIVKKEGKTTLTKNCAVRKCHSCGGSR